MKERERRLVREGRRGRGDWWGEEGDGRGGW